MFKIPKLSSNPINNGNHSKKKEEAAFICLASDSHHVNNKLADNFLILMFIALLDVNIKYRCRCVCKICTVAASVRYIQSLRAPHIGNLCGVYTEALIHMHSSQFIYIYNI